jgi:DNA-binding transcriptional regulator YiaG
MPDVAVPYELTGLLPPQLSLQLDALWANAAGGSRDETESYVRSVEVAYDAVLYRIQGDAPQTEIPGAARQEVITAMALAPVMTGSPTADEAATAVLGVAALRLGAIVGATAIVAGAAALIAEIAKKRQHRDPTVEPTIDVPSTAASIADVVAHRYESPVRVIRRVFGTRSRAELATLLMTSAPTVKSWEGGTTPNPQNARNLEYTAALARLVHEYIEPEDVNRYLYHVEVPGLGERTVADAVKDGEAEAAYNLLASALSR